MAKRTSKEMKTRVGLIDSVKGVDTASRTVTGYASTSSIDRYGEIIEPEAFTRDLPRFLEERHLFAAGHTYVNLSGEPTVIGKVTEGLVDDRGLMIAAQFDDDELSEKWWQKYKSGTINAFSVGFIPHKDEMREIEVKDADGDSTKKRVRVFTDVELLEVSAVPIPANRDSIVTNALDATQVIDLLARFTDLECDLRDVKDFAREGFNQLLAQLGDVSDRLATVGPAEFRRMEADGETITTGAGLAAVLTS